ncbi:MAG: cytochrome c4 [Chromatiaceae bacterium]|jgi:cytochrome c553|nr:cytochrome c4 [Chromatiaceae bacterium]
MTKNILFLRILLLTPSMVLSVADSFAEVDLENGEEINEVCAGCHGEFGQGGKEGEYPRLAGLPASFIAKQLELFRERTRKNLAMVEYVDHRQMPDADIADIAAYISAIELPSKLAPVDESAPGFNAYERLLATKRVVQIPRVEGDVESGRKLYRRECGSCHGSDGWGDEDDGVPMLAGQYTNYLWRQVEKYREKRRIHDESSPEDELLSEFSNSEIRDILAYLSTQDD